MYKNLKLIFGEYWFLWWLPLPLFQKNNGLDYDTNQTRLLEKEEDINIENNNRENNVENINNNLEDNENNKSRINIDIEMNNT